MPETGIVNEVPALSLECHPERIAEGATGQALPVSEDSEPDRPPLAAITAADYPTPLALIRTAEFEWNEDKPLAELYAAFGKELAKCGDLSRAPAYASGLILGSDCPRVRPAHITDARELGPVILDRLRVVHKKDGKIKGSTVPARDLTTLLRSEAFLQQFRPVDEVCNSPRYFGDFDLTQPGYNDGGPGQRILYCGPSAVIDHGFAANTRFLDVMAFETAADRTNTIAAKLTVMLRHFWPGAKPMIEVTSTKSHGGKDTVIQYAAGTTPSVSISYQAADWALERCAIGALKQNASTGVLVVENARLAKGQPYIASAFMERILTDAEPFLFSTGTGDAVRRTNNVVVALSTNFGSVSEDLLNRGLPIHLSPLGDVTTRTTPIGNPKLEYLPAERERLEAELRGMVERWKQAGCPLDKSVRHPFTAWAQTIGGILRTSGLADFLGNYQRRRTVNDPIRRAVGLLGASRPSTWRTATEWDEAVAELGLVRILIPDADRENAKARARRMGIILSAHCQETFISRTEDDHCVVRLERARRRFDSGPPSTRYRFVILEQTPLPEDVEEAARL